MSSELELLKHTDIFHEVPEEHLATLAGRAIKRTFDPDQVIFNEGDPGTSAMVVEYGEVKLTIQSPAKQVITLAHKSEGDMFGELSLFDGVPRSAAAMATTDTRCLVLRREDFLDVIETEPVVALSVLGSLARIIRRMNVMMADITTHPHLRIAKTLIDLAEHNGHQQPDGTTKIDRPVTDADLASRTGLYKAEVGPLLANLQLRDVIRRDGEDMIIVRLDELRKSLNPV